MKKKRKRERKGNRKRISKMIWILGIISMVMMLLSGCTTAENRKDKRDLNGLSVDALQAAAAEQGQLHTVGMPNNWANWGEIWTAMRTQYGIEHVDQNMSSGQELAIFQDDSKKSDADLGDVGHRYAKVAEQNGLTAKYKTSYWDSIPSWAKDDDGDWIIAYYGTMALLTDKVKVPQGAKSFTDVLTGDYTVAISKMDNSNEAQYAVLAAAIAGGGSENDIGPGITYFKQLATQGRLLETNDPMEALKSGRAAVVILWDFNALTVRDQLMAADSRRQFEACIPADGTIQSGYATIINAKGDHPETAAFAREYILSDAGQISLAKGYATPVRSVPIPAEVQVKRIPQEQYAGARMISDLDVWFLNSENLTVQWESEIAHQ